MGAAGGVDIVLTANGANVTDALDKIKSKFTELNGVTRQAGHTTVSQMQAASGAIRLLEGDITHNVRAVERFITTLPGVGNALKAAFPLVGIVALGGAIFEVGTKVYDFKKKLDEMPSAIRQSFNQMSLSLRTANDEMALASDKIEDKLNSLAGKKVDLGRTALDEMRVKADKLSESLDRDLDKMTELLRKNQIGVLGNLMGKVGTADVSGSVKSFDQDIQKLQGERQDLLDQRKTSEAEKKLKELKDKLQAAIQWDRDKENFLSKPSYSARDYATDRVAKENASHLSFDGLNNHWVNHQALGDNSANFEILGGARHVWSEQLRGINEGERNEDDLLQQQKIDNQRKYAETLKKADEQRMKLFEEQHARFEAEGKHAAQDEAIFWLQKLSAFRVGSEQYNAVMVKYYEGVKRTREEYDQTQKTGEKLEEKGGWDSSGAMHVGTRYMDEEGKQDAREQNKVLEQGRAETEKLSKAIDANKRASDLAAISSKESAIFYAEETGQITRLAAGQKLAAEHAKLYADSIRQLKDRQADIMSMTPSLQRAYDLIQSTTDMTNLLADKSKSEQKDAAATGMNPAGSPITGAKNALDDFVLATRDASKTMEQLTTNSLQQFNAELVRGITGQKMDWRSAGRGIFSNVADAGLKSAEGGIFGALMHGGKKKPTGASGDPIYVSVVSGAGVGTGLIPPLVTKKLSSLGGGSIWSSIGSAIGSIFGSKMGTGGAAGASANTGDMDVDGYAGGGTVTNDGWALVGEEGPELMKLATGSSIVPNSVLSGSGAGDTNMHMHVDARGAQDPIAVEAAVNRAMARHAPSLIQASVRAVHEHNRRIPLSQRR